MQERYLGDSHDYVKYALLRHLHASLDVQIGVNWYLTEKSIDHPDNKDGEQRHHLNGGVWGRWDADLFKRLVFFDPPENRRISKVKTQRILPDGTLFYDPLVLMEDRLAWHKEGKNALSRAELVFLDPDNGFEVKSATKRTLPKYALYEEAYDYHCADKIVVAIQFARQCSPEGKASNVKTKLRQAGFTCDIPVLRVRLAPNILFLFLSPQERIPQITTVLGAFVEKGEGKAELIS